MVGFVEWQIKTTSIEWTDPFFILNHHVLSFTLLSVAPRRRVTAHHQAQAVVPVWRVGGKVWLVTWRRRSLHPLPPAHVGDGAWEEGHSQRMPQSPLDQLVAQVITCPLFFFLNPQQLTYPSSWSGTFWNNRSLSTVRLEETDPTHLLYCWSV